jgi:hypothetical protein
VTIDLAARITHRRHTPVTGATQPPTVVEHLKRERHGRAIASTPPFGTQSTGFDVIGGAGNRGKRAIVADRVIICWPVALS